MVGYIKTLIEYIVSTYIRFMKVRIKLARPNLLAYIHISGLCRNCFMLGRNVHFEVFFLKFNVTISLLFQPFEATFLTNRSFCKWWALSQPWGSHYAHQILNFITKYVPPRIFRPCDGLGCKININCRKKCFFKR